MKYKIISDDDQYNKYCEIHEKLTFKDHVKYKDEIDLIELLIDDYENRTLELPKEMNPVELLNYIIEEEEISKTELAKQLDVSKQLISDILSYRRAISLDMVNRLSNRFKMRPQAFSRPYKLKVSRKPKQNQLLDYDVINPLVESEIAFKCSKLKNKWHTLILLYNYRELTKNRI